MTKRRYNELFFGKSELSEEEIKKGWHFCNDWDGLLIHKDSFEAQSCTCLKEFRNKGPGFKEYKDILKS